MDVITLIVESVLAVLALIIAVIQFIAERRAKKEETREMMNRAEERTVIQKLLEHVSAAEKCSSTILEFSSRIDEASQHTDNDPNEVMEMFDNTLEKYEENFMTLAPVLYEIYDELLKNEERFPMSHGYGRYIEELREILNFNAVVRERRINGYDSLRIECHQILMDIWNKGGVLDDDSKMKLGISVEGMAQSLEPYYRHAERIASVLYELNTKYNN